MKKSTRILGAAFILAAFAMQGTAAQRNKGVPDADGPELEAQKKVSQEQAKITATAIETGKQDTSVILATDGANVSVKGSSLKKSGDTTDASKSNFHGLNSAAVASKGSSLTLENVTIVSEGEGANAVVSTGKGSSVRAKNLKIHTKKNSSRGLHATRGGVIQAQNVTIETEGEHSAAFATDRGEGEVDAQKGSANTSGEGSPVVYSTGKINIKNIRGSAKESEIAVVEGKNSVGIEGCTLFGGTQKRSPRAIMLYQSMSGDAKKGTANFSAKDSALFNTGAGPFFYVTNTNAIITLENCKLDSKGTELLHVSGNDSERGWGKKGHNGGTLDFTAVKQNLFGDVFCDAISKVSLNLLKGSSFKGAINPSDGGRVNVRLDKKSSLELTADSFVNDFVDENQNLGNIISNGHTVFYNKKSEANAWLNGATVALPGGGKLVGVEREERVRLESDSGEPNSDKSDERHGMRERNPDENSGRRLEVNDYEGILRVSDDGTVSLECTDGKNYALSVIDFKPGYDGERMDGKRPEVKNPERKPSEEKRTDGKFSDGAKGERPPMGKKAAEKADKGKGKAAPDERRMPPRPVTLEDLKKMDGKKVSLKAAKKDDGLVVLSATIALNREFLYTSPYAEAPAGKTSHKTYRS